MKIKYNGFNMVSDEAEFLRLSVDQVVIGEYERLRIVQMDDKKVCVEDNEDCCLTFYTHNERAVIAYRPVS